MRHSRENPRQETGPAIYTDRNLGHSGDGRETDLQVTEVEFYDAIR